MTAEKRLAEAMAAIGSARSRSQDGAGVGADVHHRQLAGEQARDDGADGVAVVEGDARMRAAQAGDLGGERGVVGGEVGGLAPLDVGRVGRHAGLPQRLAVEGGGGDEFGRVLAGVEGDAGGVAVDVDDGAGDGGVDRGGTQLARESVELVDPPVGVLAGEPRRDAARLDV